MRLWSLHPGGLAWWGVEMAAWKGRWSWPSAFKSPWVYSVYQHQLAFCSPHIPRLLTHGWCQPELVATSYSHSQSTAAACSETWWPRRKSGGRSYAFTPTRLAFGNRGIIDCLSSMMLAQLLLKSFKHLPWNEDLETKALVILISWRFVVTPFLILSSLAQKNSSDHTMPALQGWSQHGGEGWRAFVTGFWVLG